MVNRLKAKEVKAFRVKQLDKQGGVCPLCLRKIKQGEDVLDHNHKTGYCRGTLHRGCNSMLGKIENAMVRYGLTDPASFQSFMANCYDYINGDLGIFHPTHRTDEEKRLRRNKRARKQRAIKKMEGCDEK